MEMRQAPQIPSGFEEYNYIDSSTSELFEILALIYGDECWYCDEPFVDIQDHKFSRSIDHFDSQDYCRKHGLSFEETHGIGNLRLAHKKCNSDKSNREWLDDGTLAPRGRVRAPKVPKIPVCNTCMSGRILLIGEVCSDCGSGPQPAGSPRAYQKTPKECTHQGVYFCWMCFLGHVPRKDGLT